MVVILICLIGLLKSAHVYGSTIYVSLTYEEKEGAVDAQVRQEGGEQNDLHRSTFKRRKLEEGGSIVLQFVFLLILVFDLALLRFQVKNGSALGMIQ